MPTNFKVSYVQEAPFAKFGSLSVVEGADGSSVKTALAAKF